MPDTRLALLSVSDKHGLVPLAEALLGSGYALVASGGTAKALAAAGLAVTSVETLTDSGELLGGRVKTLHPTIAAGILSRRTAADTAELSARGIVAIDVVVVDLYPFAAALADNVDATTLTETIDIGGVTLLRAAAKNAAHVLVVPGPRHYADVIQALQADKMHGLPEELAHLRRRLAAVAFRLTAEYDALIAGWLAQEDAAGGQTAPDDLTPLAQLSVLSPSQPLRYGENPCQRGGFLAPDGRAPFVQYAGKDLSYNNIYDIDAALAALGEFGAPAAVIIKHGSPCGVAVGAEDDDIASVFAAALGADPVSAFGSIIALNRPANAAFINAFGDLFAEVLVAPAYADGVIETFASRRKNLRILTVDAALHTGMRFRSALGGLLWQEPDVAESDGSPLVSANGIELPEALLATAVFADRVVKHVQSNAIVIASTRDDLLITIGIGGGQTNRVDAVAQAIARATSRFGADLSDAVLASDAFFPFADSIALVAAAGIGAIVQPGGSLRDADVLKAAADAQIPMVMTGVRHFRH